MRTGNTAAYPPLRRLPRPVIPAGAPRALFHPLRRWRGYPIGRVVDPPGPGYTPELLWRVETTDGEVTLGDANTDVFTASGTPDKWRFTARTNGALIVPTDVIDREEDAILVQVGEAVELYLPRRRIRARNATAGSNALLSVEAYFAGPVFSFDAR